MRWEKLWDRDLSNFNDDIVIKVIGGREDF